MTPAGSPLAKFSQELLRRHEERILLEDAPDDDHWMSSHDVNHRIAAKATEMVRTDDRVVMAKPHVINARLKLDDIVDTRSICNRPVHTTTNATQGKSSLGVSAGQLLKHLQHSILIEAPIWKVDFSVGPQLKLPALLRDRRIDADASQASQMVVALLRVQNVNGFVAAFQPFLYEWKQNAIFFLIVVEKRANVTRLAELGSGKGNGC
jgi:hypothetical protein